MHRFLGTLALTATLAVSGTAQADETGQSEYMEACASCHGASGMADGPLAEIMTVPVPDLVGLTARNDGVFPMLDVIHTIDGRQGTRGHGYPMPVWGKRFREDASSAGPFAAEIAARGRILSIAYYLETIQQ